MALGEKDGLTIIYIQDILVLKSYQRNKIGTQFIQQIQKTYNHVRQKVLLADERPDLRHFYESQGFFSCDKGEVVSFVRFDV